jgi:hypothetical protein
MQELIKRLNDLKIHQTSSAFEEDLLDEKLQIYFRDCVAEELDIDRHRHRWYEYSTSVFRVDGKFLGVKVVSQCYSENSDIEDAYHYLIFCEMKEIKTTSYTQS